LNTYKGQNLELKNEQLTMYYGLDTGSFISSGFKQFDLDLSFDKIIFNIHPEECKLELDCEITSDDIQNGTYKDKSFTYQSANTFLSWENIADGVVKSRDQYNSLRTFSVLNTNFDGKNQSVTRFIFLIKRYEQHTWVSTNLSTLEWVTEIIGVKG
jgi:hypothetical protein